MTGTYGSTIMYDWNQLDYSVDQLVAARLSPGFEFMGSPAGFPQLPSAFWTTTKWNTQLAPNDTLALFRTVVRDVLLHYIDRHGAAEVEAWNLESWNEPECGWGWPPRGEATNDTNAAFLLYYDAVAAGVADAEAAANVKLRLGGPAACGEPSTPKSPNELYDLFFTHADSGTNAWTGAPVRLDFWSTHRKGNAVNKGGSSAGVVTGGLGDMAWLRTQFGKNSRLLDVPYLYVLVVGKRHPFRGSQSLTPPSPTPSPQQR